MRRASRSCVAWPTGSRARALVGLLVLLGAQPGCGRHDAAFEPYADATLEAGKGLGDLLLEQTTLGSVVQRFGVESVTQLASDEVGLELLYEHGALALLFLVDPDCLRTLPGGGLRSAAFDLPGLLEQSACLRETRLSSLSVRADPNGGSAFFRGTTDAGVRLGGGLADPLAHGEPGAGSPHILAGMNPNNPREQLHFGTGISFYLKRPEGGGPESARIQRISIFPPLR